jgi:hypothetical protein
MHLNNDELFEIPENKRSHLANCSVCQERLNNIDKFRNNLKNTSQAELPHHIKSKVIADISKKKSRSLVKLITSFSIAATIAITTAVLIINNSSNTHLNDLIVKSQKLELKYNHAKTNNNFKIVNYGLHHDLTKIDIKLQESYLSGESNEHLSELWKTRIDLLNSLLNKVESQRRIVTI